MSATERLGAMIKARRTSLRLDGFEVAARARVSGPSLSRYEKGKQVPRAPIFRRLLDALEVPAEDRDDWDRIWIAAQEDVPEVASEEARFRGPDRGAVAADAGPAPAPSASLPPRDPLAANDDAQAWRRTILARVERLAAYVEAELEEIKRAITPPYLQSLAPLDERQAA